MPLPCIDQHEMRQSRVMGGSQHVGPAASQKDEMLGPEPSYTNIVSGYDTFICDQPFALDYGSVLPSYQIAYETWGTLAPDRGNAVLVEHVVAFNYSAAPERFKVIAETLGIDCRGLSHAQIRQRLVEHLIAFKSAVGFHETLARHGVGSSDIPFLSRHAMHDPCILTNPRQSSQRDVEVVYGEAL